jgi:hypothetical protein
MSYELKPVMAGDGFWIMGTAAEALGARKLTYLNPSGTWNLADADMASRMPIIGITGHAIGSGLKGIIFLYGFIGDSSWTWTQGGPIYGTATPGELSQTAAITIRQTIGYAYTPTLIYFDPKRVENVVYWSDTHRSIYSPTGVAKTEEVLSGGEWWVVSTSYGEGYRDNFNGIFDITGLGVASVISNYAYYAAKVGAGTFLANTGASSGMRITTGALINNSNLIATGDATGIGGSWNPTQTIWMHLHYRFPNAGDAANSYFLGCFYQDANNYVGMRYDTAIDANLRLVTRAAAAETLTVVGALDTDWHEILVKFATGEVRFCQDGGTVVVHTTNVPVGNFAWYTYLETLAAAAKNYDVSLLTIWQDEVEP